MKHRLYICVALLSTSFMASATRHTDTILMEEYHFWRTAGIIGLILFILLLVILIAMTHHFLRIINNRNYTLLKVLNGLDAYRNAAMYASITQNAGNDVASTKTMLNIAAASDHSPLEETDDDVAEDEALFIKMDAVVTKERLFLNPNFSRDHLMRIIGVDKNRFGKMMGRYSDASNASVYINVKRVEYGAYLLKMHPEYTIAAIAVASGMSNTVTFNRIFKEVYGMTPSEYRKGKGLTA